MLPRVGISRKQLRLLVTQSAESEPSLLQIDFEITSSTTLARMNEITIDLDAGTSTMRRVAEEPRCEFPVVPDRLVGEILAPFISCLSHRTR